MQQNYQGGDQSSWLLGDSGYPLQPWLMTPFNPPPPHDTPEGRFNDSQSQTRSCVERCIGVWKARFRCLRKDRVLHYTPERAVLHNIALQYRVPNPEGLIGEELDHVNPPREGLEVDHNHRAKKSFNVMTWNAGGAIRRKSPQLLHFLTAHHIDVAMIQETHLRPKHRWRIPGYFVYRTDRPARQGQNTTSGGGTAVLIAEDVISRPVTSEATSLNLLETTSAILTANHLGVTLNRRLTLVSHVQKVAVCAREKRRALLPILRSPSVPMTIKRITYEVIIRSALLYASPAWSGLLSSKGASILSKVERSILRSMLAHGWIFHNLITYSQCAIDPILDVAKERAKKFFARLPYLSHSHLRELTTDSPQPWDIFKRPISSTGRQGTTPLPRMERKRNRLLAAKAAAKAAAARGHAP
ncbi:hypothetical protein J437_LFUL009884 [Ladona fulva]|uniref:Endonuclease/exonuclease/phosphatase domain-containing protein n=1 Tax=Ladona fulva TaxID=123851 RepID=A0A8K0K7H9_LADFU|nr:hypothetical protein J437_LFUL009884 [Ladona fulva]